MLLFRFFWIIPFLLKLPYSHFDHIYYFGRLPICSPVPWTPKYPRDMFLIGQNFLKYWNKYFILSLKLFNPTNLTSWQQNKFYSSDFKMRCILSSRDWIQVQGWRVWPWFYLMLYSFSSFSWIGAPGEVWGEKSVRWVEGYYGAKALLWCLFDFKTSIVKLKAKCPMLKG